MTARKARVSEGVRKGLTIISIGLIVAGCAITYGREFDTTKVSQIVKGKTTKEEVRAMLGEPATVTQTADFER